MSIADALKFVKGAVSTKNFVPAMQHFAIKDGSVSAFNGVVSLSSPIDVDLVCAPKAVPLVAALDRCGDVVTLDMTAAERLHVKSSGFGVFVDCLPLVEVPTAHPKGHIVDVDGDRLLAALNVLKPFIGDDASRPWSNGVLLKDGCAFATNNVTLVQYWLGEDLGVPVNIPAVAVRELMRIKQTPQSIQVSESSVTFHFDGGRWLNTLLFDADAWPTLTTILDVQCAPTPFPEEFFTGLANIKPFLDEGGRVYFHDGAIATTHTPQSGIGAYQRVPGLDEGGIYTHAMLTLLDGVATQIDFSLYPRQCIFYGDNLRGAIIGMRPA